MMTKIRSIQDSWLAKSILILTALSFMSLFGVSGYLSSAAGNRPIIRVDDIVVYQDEINNQYNQELQMAKSLFGDSLDISDTMKNAIMQSIVQKDLVNAVLQKTAEDWMSASAMTLSAKLFILSRNFRMRPVISAWTNSAACFPLPAGASKNILKLCVRILSSSI